MEEMAGREDIHSRRVELAEIGRSFRSSFNQNDLSFRSTSNLESSRENDDEYELQWAAIERLPTFERLRTSVFIHDENEGACREAGTTKLIDVTKLGPLERRVFIDKLIKNIEEDNAVLLRKLKERIDRVGVESPTVEVTYKNLLAGSCIMPKKTLTLLALSFLLCFLIFILSSLLFGPTSRSK